MIMPNRRNTSSAAALAAAEQARKDAVIEAERQRVDARWRLTPRQKERPRECTS